MIEIKHGPHILLHEDGEGHPCVSADDYELYDMLEDYLTEDCDFNFEFLQVPDWPRTGDFTIVVESGITFEEIAQSVQRLNLDEIERIYLLNNPANRVGE